MPNPRKRLFNVKPRQLNRRQFLGHSCGALATSATVSSSLLQLGLARNAAADGADDYKALVCILLAGGNDSFNMLVPNDADQYAEYSAIRADLALPQAELLPLSGSTAAGRNYAVHPGMPHVQSLYDAGELAMIANVGTLIEPVDAAAIEAGARIPLGLASHADQIAQWQTAQPDTRTAQGWGGRIADLLNEQNAANGISMSISLSGTNLFQAGRDTVEYSISAEENGALGIIGYNDGSDFEAFRRRTIDNMLSVSHDNLLRREYSERLRRSIDSQSVFTAALTNASGAVSGFSDNPISKALRQIARTIAARSELGACRQTFFVLAGGWDHHDEVLDNQARMLPLVSQGLSEFRNALVDLGVFNKVTTFTSSDFGRTLTSNGKGSDHGWGGHHMVMGGAVKGGQIYGNYPILSPTSSLDVGRGVYIPTLSIDSYFAELSLWLGVNRNDLDTVLPNVRNFYSPQSSAPPLGFLLS